MLLGDLELVVYFAFFIMRTKVVISHHIFSLPYSFLFRFAIQSFTTCRFTVLGCVIVPCFLSRDIFLLL